MLDVLVKKIIIITTINKEGGRRFLEVMYMFVA